jgi:threonine aldolase
LLALENTLGGKVLPMAYLQQATALARSKGLATHLDGARLFNAAVAQAAANGNDARSEARRIAGLFDSVSVCFSKGLGAPVGSALCGSRDFIARARRIRKMAGGAMRQSGLLAAAAAYALDQHVERLAQDHALARRLAEGLSGIEGVQVEEPHTNILFVDLAGPAHERSAGLIPALAGDGVLATGLYRLRFATHLDVDSAGIDRAIGAIRAYFRA